MAGRYWGGDIGKEGGDTQTDLDPGHAKHRRWQPWQLRASSQDFEATE